MRIAYLCADFGIPVRGHKGASVHVREMVAALADQGHEVRVITPNGTGDNALTAPVTVIEPPRLPAALERAMRAIFRRSDRAVIEARELSYNLTLYRRLALALEAWRPDAMYERYSLFNVSGVALARRFGIPHLLEVNAPLRLERARHTGLVFGGPAHLVERTAFARTKALLVVSSALQHYVQQHGADPARVSVLPNGVDIQRFIPADDTPDSSAGRQRVRSQWNREPGDFVVGFAGSLKPWHGVDTLLDAFVLLREREPNARLLIAGDGPMAGELRRRTAALGIGHAVILAGKVAHADMPAVLAAMDVAVAPYRSVPDFYFSPLKIYEYLAVGLPVVASDAGDIAGLIEDGSTGLLCPPGNVAELAERLIRLAADQSLRARLGAAARAEAERHTWQANAARVVELIDALRSGHPAPGRPPLAAATQRSG